MEFTQFQIIMSFVLVFTGTMNTLSTKWADKLQANGSDGVLRKFDHPFVQSCVMFIGEIMCLIAFKILFYYYRRRQIVIEDVDIIRGSQNFNPFLFLPPAMCDMVATSLMNIGLIMTSPSSYQMLRGSIIIFVALLSINFVGREVKKYHWTGIAFITLGLFVVGWSDVSSSKQNDDPNTVITGDLLIVIAQIISACQMVYEEKFVVDKDIPPLQAVGWEGTFGFIVLSFLLFPLYTIKVGYPFAQNAHGVLEDLPDALVQMKNNSWILISCLCNMISIAFFNFAGICMTKEVSATTRMVLDSVRTFFVWLFCFVIGWQKFSFLQLSGFGILLFGMSVYYRLIPQILVYLRLVRTMRRVPSEEPIVNQRADCA